MEHSVELAVLGYYLEKYGNTEFSKAVATGSKEQGNDIHTLNQHIMKLPNRNLAKQAIYGICYSIGGAKLALNIMDKDTVVAYTDEEYHAAKEIVESKVSNGYYHLSDTMIIPYTPDLIEKQIYGTQVKNNLIHNLKGYKELLRDCTNSLKKSKSIKSLDGRLIFSEDSHKGVNYLLQSSGAIFMKYYLQDVFITLKDTHKLVLHKDYDIIANIHDAVVVETTPNHQEVICQVLRDSFKRTSDKFNFTYAIKGEPIVGRTLYDIF